MRRHFTAVYVRLWKQAELSFEKSSPVAWLMLCLALVRQIFA